jgi:hypothetical protein
MPTPPKRWALKDLKVVKAVRRLAAEPDQVRATARSMRDMADLRITVTGVCRLICEWIDAGEELMETITRYDAVHVGQPAYELCPVLEDIALFIKVTIVERGGDHELLLLVSVHRQEGGRHP